LAYLLSQALLTQIVLLCRRRAGPIPSWQSLACQSTSADISRLRVLPS